MTVDDEAVRRAARQNAVDALTSAVATGATEPFKITDAPSDVLFSMESDGAIWISSRLAPYVRAEVIVAVQKAAELLQDDLTIEFH